MRTSLFIAAFTLVATADLAQQPDPYAKIEQDQRHAIWDQKWAPFFDRVKDISFARHCRVFTNYNWFIGQNLIRVAALANRWF
jgi:hypothetical protein